MKPVVREKRKGYTGAKKRKSRTPIIVLGLVVAGVLVSCLVALLSHYGSKKDAEEYFARLEVENSKTIQEAVSAVQQTLSGTSGTSRVFDQSNRLVFMFKESSGVDPSTELSPELSAEFKTQLLGQSNSEKLSRQNWVDANATHLPFSSSVDLQTEMSKSLGVAATRAYCKANSLQATSDAEFVIALALEERFTEQELLLYCASVNQFGEDIGIASAAASLFGKPFKDLNSWQQSYILRLYSDPDCTWEEWRTTTHGAMSAPEEVDSGLLSVGGSSTTMLRQYVNEELTTVVGERKVTENFDVELALDSALQSEMQNKLDTAFASSLNLETDGRTTLDGTVMVIDTETGLVKSYIGGRSINKSAHELALNEESKLGVYEEARVLFAQGTGFTYNGLVTCMTSEGTTDYISMQTLLKMNRLDLLQKTPTLETHCTLSELVNFCLSMYHGQSSKPQFISQVMQSGGSNAIYKAAVLRDEYDTYENTNLRLLFTEKQSDECLHYREYYRTGQVFADMTSQYIVCGIVGSDVFGYALTESDNDLLTSVVDQLVQVPVKYFPEKYKPANSVQEFVDLFNQADNRNATVVITMVDGFVEDLERRPIASKQDRLDFETAYAEYTTTVARYADVMNADALEVQVNRLNTVRANRANELLQFVA